MMTNHPCNCAKIPGACVHTGSALPAMNAGQNALNKQLRSPPVLAAFIDGLRPDSVEHMPFVSSLSKPARIRTELGYSITCHPSMYTGVWPEQHLSWFIWKYDPDTSPFRWLKETGWSKIPDTSYTRYGLYRLTKVFKSNSAFFSLPFPAFVPIKNLPYFDVTEKKFWDEDQFNPHFPTIFEIFRERGISTNIVGMDKTASNAAEKILRTVPTFSDFTYLFFGDIDYVSHMKGHDSPQARERLRRVDQAIELWYRSAVKTYGEPLFMLWSDHGHIPIEEQVDVARVFHSHGLDIDDFIHFVDSNYIRFWFRNENEQKQVERVVPDLGKGFIITPEIAERYHVRMPDNRYGDLIFYLEAPAVFHKGTFNVFGRKLTSPDVSMHGYSPENSGVDGTLVTNRNISFSRRPILQDIPPTLLKHFKIPVPDYMVGDSLW